MKIICDYCGITADIQPEDLEDWIILDPWDGTKMIMCASCMNSPIEPTEPIVPMNENKIMQATFNFIPQYCPLCGNRILPTATETERAIVADYLAGNQMMCRCGLEFRKEQDIFKDCYIPDDKKRITES